MHPLADDPDRVVLAGDWHGDTDHAESVIRWAAGQNAQGVVQLGDFGIWPGEGGRRYRHDLDAVLAETGLWLAFIDGNHEDFWWLNEQPLDDRGTQPVGKRIWHLPRGLAWRWHGKVWFALGGATSLDRPSRRLGISWWPEETISSIDMGRALAAFDSHWPVEHMLTHDCPGGVEIPGLPPESMWPTAELVRANDHRKVLAEIVQWAQPKHLWHGHFHVRHETVRAAENHVAKIHGLNDNTGPWHENTYLLDLNP